MPIPLPDLATITYEDIIDEMVVSIPKFTNKWTNHNPSDPGITILELLSWIAEATLYRIDRIPEESYINFLRLIAGASGADVDKLISELKKDPDFDKAHMKLLEFLKEVESDGTGEKSRKNIVDIKSAAHDFLNSHYRAVTEDNFRSLAIEATQTYEEAKVKRAVIYEHSDEGMVEIIIISDRRDKYSDLIKKVNKYLQPRKLIGTKITVKEPDYTSVKIYTDVVCELYANKDTVKKTIEDTVTAFLDPVTGGPEKEGWPYGRNLTVFEIYRIIEDIDGVHHAQNVKFDDDTGKSSKKIQGLPDLEHLVIDMRRIDNG